MRSLTLSEAFMASEVSPNKNRLTTLSEGLRLKEISGFSGFTSFTQIGFQVLVV